MKIILILFISIILNANSIEVNQNIRALYKGVKLDKEEIQYIKKNKHKNIKIIKKILAKNKNKLVIGKSVVSFTLTKNNNINKIYFLIDDDEELNNIIENILKSEYINFKKPNKDTKLRFIIKIQKTHKNKFTHIENQNKKSNQTYLETIYNGTTRFEYSSKAYIRKFKTSRDGFIDILIKPYNCGNVEILTAKNQKINPKFSGSLGRINTEIPKGKYKLILNIKKTCDITLQYL